MEVNTRPLLYGSRHPFYVIGADGALKSSEHDLSRLDPRRDARVVVGRCCESGDSQSLDEAGHIVPRVMAAAEPGDLVVVGGAGAYCASMSPFNYNSHLQAPEVLLRADGRLQLIRRAQTLEQVTANETGLEG
jgi:diaminopimelate decarboxylase